MVSISRYLDRQLIDRITSLSTGGGGGDGQAVAQALRGGGGQDRITRTIRFGAQAYATSLSGINFTASAVNLVQSDLEQLGALTKNALLAIEEATAPNSTKQSRDRANEELYTIGRQFEKIVDAAQIGDKEYLTLSGLTELFVQIGLDPQSSKSTEDAFDTIIADGPQKLLASSEIAADPSNSSGSVFGSGRRIKSYKDAQKIKEDLLALNNQIETNIGGIEELRGVLAENAVLVRSTSIAFDEVSSQISNIEDASELAKALQREIGLNAASVSAQAENLEPLIVAALTFQNDNLLE